MQSRGRRRTGAVLLAFLVGLPGVAGCASAGSSAADPAASVSASASDPLPAGLTDALARRGQAVLRREPAAWLAGIDPTLPAFVTAQRQLFANLSRLPLQSWTYRPGRLIESGADRVRLHVDLIYRLQGDTRDITRDQLVTLTRSTGRWLVCDQQPGLPQPPELWDLGPIAVSRGARSVVVGAVERRGELAEFAADLDAAATRVDAVWGSDWSRSVVALVPADPAAMARLLGPDRSGGLDRLAAVAIGEVDVSTGVGSTLTGRSRPTADRVVLNADAISRFGQVGRMVVLTHEVAHLATRASHRVAPPLWLQEGFADYLAYRDTGLPATAVAADLIAQVEAGQAPSALPGPEQFDATRPSISAAYAAGWLAVDLIDRQYGPAAVIRFYRTAAGIGSAGVGSAGTVGSEQALDAAFRGVLGTDQQAFVARWRAAVADLAG